MKLAAPQLQNRNSAVGYYEWEWAGFSLRGWKHIQSDLLPRTRGANTSPSPMPASAGREIVLICLDHMIDGGMEE